MLIAEGIWERRYSGGILQGGLGESQPTESTDDAESRTDFRSVQGDFIYRHHNGLRVELCAAKEETFFIPVECIDVTRSLHTDLNILQEKNVDVSWNVDSNSNLSDSWKEIWVVWREMGKSSNHYTRPDHVSHEVWTKIGKVAQN